MFKCSAHAPSECSWLINPRTAKRVVKLTPSRFFTDSFYSFKWDRLQLLNVHQGISSAYGELKCLLKLSVAPPGGRLPKDGTMIFWSFTNVSQVICILPFTSCRNMTQTWPWYRFLCFRAGQFNDGIAEVVGRMSHDQNPRWRVGLTPIDSIL
jgi:hypothetical protein